MSVDITFYSFLEFAASTRAHPLTINVEFVFVVFPLGFTSGTADAAHSDNTAASAHRGSPEEGGGWRPRWEAAKISGKESSGCHTLQTEEEGLGDVTGKESRRTHPDKYAASGVSYCLYSQDIEALFTFKGIWYTTSPWLSYVLPLHIRLIMRTQTYLKLTNQDIHL